MIAMSGAGTRGFGDRISATRIRRDLVPEHRGDERRIDQHRDRRLPADYPEHMRGRPAPFEATISTGGAAKLVSVPPIDTLTNSVPSVAYLSFFDTWREKIVSRNISAASVIAAGSVIKDPSSGTTRQADEVKRDRPCDREHPGRAVDAVCRELHHRAARGNHHDGENEHRLGEMAAVEVADRVAPAVEKRHRHQE